MSRHILAVLVLGLCFSGTVGQLMALPVCMPGFYGLREHDNCRNYICENTNRIRIAGTCPSGRCFVPSHNICALPSELRCGASMGTTRFEPPRVFAFFGFGNFNG